MHSIHSFVNKLNRHLDDMMPIDENMLPQKYSYNRPKFLMDKYEIVNLKERLIFSYSTDDSCNFIFGYAESCNNRGSFNEDQACFGVIFDENEMIKYKLNNNFYFFCLFDGHLAWGPSLFARENIEYFIKFRLEEMLSWHTYVTLTNSLLQKVLIGVLENSFLDLDRYLQQEHYRYNLKGGTTALICMFHSGVLYTANAGDSRAIIVSTCVTTETPISRSQVDINVSSTEDFEPPQYFEKQISKMFHLTADCSPFNDRKRIYDVIKKQPYLLKKGVTLREYSRILTSSDLNTPVLYREPNHVGWSMKTVELDDLNFPLINNTGKKGRLLGRIGVVRGFGNFRMKSIQNIPIKPFLTAMPIVTAFNISQQRFLMTGTEFSSMSSADIRDVALYPQEFPNSNTKYSVSHQFLVMATDGVWDALGGSVQQIVADCVKERCLLCDNENLKLEEQIAISLLEHCRDLPNETEKVNGLKESKNYQSLFFSDDDLSVFVIRL